MRLSIKMFISTLLCSNWIGRVVAWIYEDQIPFYGTLIYTGHEQIRNRIKAMLFWRMYESSEIRFVQKHLTDQYDTIELGSSIGAVTIQLGKKIKGKKLIAIEANPNLIPVLQHNIRMNAISNVVVTNAAYGSDQNKVWFEYGDENILGKITTPSKDKNGVWIESMSLSSMLRFHQLTSYALVCDIEGAEADLLLNEQEALRGCKLLIIETHHTSFKGQAYSPDQLKLVLLEMGFRLIDQHGVNLVLIRD